MSTTDLASPPPSLSPPPPAAGRRILRGTVWLSVRQERTPLLVCGVVLLAVCAWLLFLGTRIGDYVDTQHIQNCNVVHFPAECEQVTSRAIELDTRWLTWVLITGWFLVALPPALGLFVAAPLLAREFESGTYGLAWTQSVSRQRWLAARLGVPLVATLVGSCLLAVVSTWWVGQIQGRFAVPGYYHWFTWLSRATSGPSVVGFSLLGVALGAAVGLVVRRVVASIVVTAALTAVVRVAVDASRYLLTPAREAVADIRMAALPADHQLVFSSSHLPTSTPIESDIVENGLLTSDGQRIPLPGDWLSRMPDGTGVCPTDECSAHQDTIVQAYATYHPPAAEWAMHWTQSGVCLAVTALLVLFCAFWIRRVR
ncbi:hypothetical protein [Kitasatospora sp. NPDC088548]|uniref:hypothetical protein n=1 Tax=Kitasatospora sp. NPDC088548 TaxID=3364075 RepID=UPI00382BB8B2